MKYKQCNSGISCVSSTTECIKPKAEKTVLKLKNIAVAVNNMNYKQYNLWLNEFTMKDNGIVSIYFL